MTLSEIQESLATEQDPAKLAEHRVVLSHKYSTATDKLEACEKLYADWWDIHRDNYKSDTATDKAWEKTEVGQEQRHWKYQIRKIDKMMNAISSLIKVKTGQAMNQF